MADKTYIPVASVDNGMFKSERIVSVNVNERTFTLIVDSQDLKGRALRVNVLEQRGPQTLVDLPREPFSGGSGRLLVPTGMLRR